MTTARQLFCRAANAPFHDGSRVWEAVESFKAAAALWREAGNYFFAGYAMSNAISASWGSEYDDKDLGGLLSAALQDFGKCVETSPTHSHESLSALCVWLEDLRKMIPLNLVGGIHLKRAMRDLGAELAQRLMSLGADSPNAEYYLVRGHTVATDLAGKWEAWFPSEKGKGIEVWGTKEWGNVLVTFRLPSAFGLFISGGDYRGAAAIIERCPQAFTTPELRGWKAAVRGFLNPEEAPERFREAATAFAEDTRPSDEELMQKDGPWSSFNVEVQSKYFLAKAALAMAGREPERLKEHLLAAASYCDAIDSFWFDGSIIRFRILTQTLAGLISDESALTAEQAREQFLTAVMISGEDPDDLMTLHFLELSAAAIEGFKNDPARELASGRLGVALEALSRIPIIDSQVVGLATPAIRNRALEEILGPQRTWIHRTLESIKDENHHLQKIVLRLAQASLPLYAQIRQGPLEYGKDIVALVERDGRLVLQMYQVKCGVINMSKWRETRNELEEMFLAPLSNFQLPQEPNAREAILICNGHASPHAEPVMEGWFEEQHRAYGRKIKFMHLDAVVNWIVRERLINEFKAALSEVGVQPIF
jgi:hypothetical protein